MKRRTIISSNLFEWTRNPARRAAAFTLGSLVIFVIGYLTTYVKSQYFGRRIDELLFYRAEDPGYVAGDYSDDPILGVHRFGDFLTTTSWSRLQYPYDVDLDFPSIYGPTAMVFARLFDFAPIILALAVFLICMTGMVVYSLWYGLENLQVGPKILLIICLVFLSRPFLFSLDRGNLQGIVVALEALAIFSILRGKTWISVWAIVVATSMKFYPVILIGLLIYRKKYREAIAALAASGLIILLGLQFMSGKGILTGLNGLLKGFAINGELNISGGSGTAWLSRFFVEFEIIDLTELTDQFQKNTNVLVAAALVGLLLLGGFRKCLTYTRVSILLLSLTTLLIPVSWAYNLMWASIAVVLLISRDDWLTGKPIIDAATILGFIPMLVIYPFGVFMSGVIATSTAEVWTFPFMCALFAIWAIFPATKPYERHEVSSTSARAL